jgi:hypothetical protein
MGKSSAYANGRTLPEGVVCFVKAACPTQDGMDAGGRTEL